MRPSLAACLSLALLAEPSHSQHAPRAAAQSATAELEPKAAVQPVFDARSAQALQAEWRDVANTLIEALEHPDASPKSLRVAATEAARRVAAANSSVVDAAPRTAARLLAIAKLEDHDALDRAIDAIVADLQFVPFVEAPLPVGWPPTAPVDEVVLKSYPRYRMARSPMKNEAQSTRAFWQLFNHIKQNDIAMTAPVQMNDGVDGDTGQMAFLYRNPELGALGPDGAVEVVDVEATLAISIGQRGYRQPMTVEQLVLALEHWVERNHDGYEACGPVRVMGFNSPVVAGPLRFYEVEMPVRAKARAAVMDGATPRR